MAKDETFVRDLRQVFDLCDELKCGFISVDQLTDIVRKHFGGGEEDIVRLIRCLDPRGYGVVTFQDFCLGVQKALELADGHSQEIFSSRPDLSTSCHPPVIETSVPVDDEMCQLDYSLPASHSPMGDVDSALATASDISQEYGDKRDISSPSVSDGEEKFEYDGEAEDAEENGTSQPHLRLNLSSDSFRSTSSVDSAASGKRRRSHHSFKRPSSSRLSARSQLRNMRNGCNSPRNSRRSSLSYDSDDRYMDQLSPEDELELSQKVEELEHQVYELRENQTCNDDRYSKVKQENAVLMSKIHSLEEQIRELEVRSDEQIKEKEKRLKDVMTRQARENKMEKEQLCSLQHENLQLKGEIIQLKLHIQNLQEEKRQLQEQLADMRNDLISLQEEHKRLKEVARREREEFINQRTSTEKLVQELHDEVEELRHYKQDAEVALRARSPSLLELPAQYRELEEELKKVKKENRELLEINESQAQMLHESFHEGKILLHTDNSSATLADEFDSCTKDELMKALKEQEEVNAKLKTYIDGILLNILENNPQLLER